MAFFDYSNLALAPEALWVSISAVGAAILVTSGFLFLAILIRGATERKRDPGPYRFAVAVHPPTSLPLALNTFSLWVALMIGLTVVNYGFPIAQLMALKNTSVPAVYVGVTQ